MSNPAGNAGHQVAFVAVRIVHLGAQRIADETDPLREPGMFQLPSQLLGEQGRDPVLETGPGPVRKRQVVGVLADAQHPVLPKSLSGTGVNPGLLGGAWSCQAEQRRRGPASLPRHEAHLICRSPAGGPAGWRHPSAPSGRSTGCRCSRPPSCCRRSWACLSRSVHAGRSA
jgi:hypothetical protein